MINSPDVLQDTDLMRVIGVQMEETAPQTIARSDITSRPKVQVHSVRMANRLGKRGQKESEYVVEIIQSRDAYFDPEIQKLADAREDMKLKQLLEEEIRQCVAES